MDKKLFFTSDWFSHNQAVWDREIAPHLSKIDAPNVLEIGAFEGRSSLYFLENFSNLMLTVIDPWAYTNDAGEETNRRFLSNIASFNDRVIVMRGKSQLMRKLDDHQYDIVYIDGEHTSAAVLHDAILAYELVKVGGLLIFDDYQGGDKSLMYPKPAIDFFTEAYGSLSKIRLVSDGYQRIYKKMDGAAPPKF